MCRASGNNEICTKNLETALADRPETYGCLDLIAFGFPCQDISNANPQGEGLQGERSGIFFECMRIINALIPKWIIIENVPRLLSINEGRDMAIVLQTLAESGYGWSYRVLDSQYFGVPQRRKRVFIVGCFGEVPSPSILYEPQRGQRNDPPDDEASPKSKCIAAESGTRNDSSVETIIGRTITTQTGLNNFRNDTIIANTIRARGRETGECSYETIIGKTLNTGDRGNNYAWRDDYIASINDNGKRKITGPTRWLDGPRGKVIGNAVTVPVIEWIGKRIADFCMKGV